MTAPALVLGAAGQVGTELLRRAPAAGIRAIGLGRDACDITDPAQVAAALARAAPAVVINAAAYTAVDQAEAEPDRAHAVNALAPGVIGRAAAAAGVPVLHISTDYVFDGRAQAPYREDHPPNPLGVYGRTKREGEQHLAAATADHAILRAGWVYSGHHANFLVTMLRLAGERPVLRVVEDQRGAPTHAADVADALLAIAGRWAAGAPVRGLVHLGGQGVTSWHGFASAIMAARAALGGGPTPVVEPIPTAAYPTPAARPAFSALDGGRLAGLLDWRPAPWQRRCAEAVREAMDTHHGEAGP